MLLNHLEKFQRAHLEWDRDVAEGVYHDDVITVFVHLQVGTPVVCDDGNLLRKLEIFPRQRDDLSVDFYAEGF